MKIAIVGSGNGAVTAAVDMVNQGHEVKLYCRNSSIHKFDRALEKGGFDFNNEGKLNVSFDYIDWKNSGFGQISRDYYYEYKKFGIIPELDYAKKEIKDIEQFIKEQEEK